MCGLVGIFSAPGENAPEDLIRSMAQTLSHRGPDEEGYKMLDGAALGFDRLAIIDLSSGSQPMSNEDETLWIIFNGEIYNFQSLHEDLIKTGRHRFKTRSDTEIILHLYEEFGEKCVDYLRGMFAFAIWDTKKKTLFAARDRFGKKPLIYFKTRRGGIALASELKALLRHPDCPRAIDLTSVDLYLHYQYIPSPRTIFQNVFKLPPAHTLTWSSDKGIQTHRYWDLRFEPKTTITYEDAKERLRTRLSESVKLRMIADVPLGAFLSGGIDSSIVVALMAQQSTKPIKTFSIGFKEETFSELKYARAVAKKYNTDHHEFIVEPHLVDVLPKLAWYYSEPYADSSALPSYYLCRETRQHVTVALNGDGGDENFGGYERYRHMEWLHLLSRVPSRFWETAARVVRSQRLKHILEAAASPLVSQYDQTITIFRPEDRERLWEEVHLNTLRRQTICSTHYLDDIVNAYKPEDWLDEIFSIDFRSYVPECLMVKMDIASMANSLETRSPLLDHIFVEECARLPSAWKLSAFKPSKAILRDAFAKELPKEILTRGKQGFGVPIGEWFRGPLNNFLKDILLSPKAIQRGYFRKTTIQTFIDEHTEGRRDRTYGLWTLLMLELWHEQFAP